MKHNPDIHHRRSIRLADYDYSSKGAYFVTVVTQHRLCLLGEVADGTVNLNDRGSMIVDVWNKLPARFPSLESDAFIVMPNHVHGIIVFVGAPLVGAQNHETETSNIANQADTDRAGTRPAPTLGDVVGAFKSITTNACIEGVRKSGWPPFSGKLWQRNYYEHVIRNEYDLNTVRQYILSNPASWQTDSENPLLNNQSIS